MQQWCYISGAVLSTHSCRVDSLCAVDDKKPNYQVMSRATQSKATLFLRNPPAEEAHLAQRLIFAREMAAWQGSGLGWSPAKVQGVSEDMVVSEGCKWVKVRPDRSLSG